MEKSEPEKEPVAADRVETEAKSFSHDIDFASLSDGQRKFFTPQMINNGVLKIDGIYPSSRAWKENYGNGKRNAIPISKNAIQNFSFSIVFYPRSGGQYGFHRNYPIFVLSRSMRYFALMMPDRKLGVALSNFDVKFDTGFEVEPDRWHACQVSLSVPEKRIEVIFDGKVKRFALTPDFSFRTSMRSVAMENFCFTNYSAGRTFYGDFRHIRIYERALSFDELRTLSGDIAAKFIIGKYAAANVKNVQDETTAEQLVAQYSRADEIEKKRISSQIASIIIMQLRMKLDDDVDSCIKLLEKCKNIKHSRSDDGWQVVVETIQDAYIKAIKNHDNRRVAKIYEVWKAVDPVPAKNIHRMYTAFIREFLRFNLVEAQNVLNRHKKYSAKYLSPLKEMLDETKKIMNWKLLNSAYADNTSELKAVLHELELIGGSKSDADTVERNARKRKKLDGSMSRAEMKKQLFRAVANGELWRARMAIDAGAGRHEKEVLTVVFSNGRHGRRNGDKTVWQRLMPKLNSQSGIDRQIMIGILLLIMDNERLTAREMKELEHIKEIAGFVYQK